MTPVTLGCLLSGGFSSGIWLQSSFRILLLVFCSSNRQIARRRRTLAKCPFRFPWFLSPEPVPECVSSQRLLQTEERRWTLLNQPICRFLGSGTATEDLSP